ncbi:hypothetical protein [Zobellia sp. 1_MG-2023]|uniref:hypothetical protein n=1 Tax=Zobellia sp. 1_MG-2023 TaxID=3062626 RepID=UPI0026E2B2DB|nr:hypothetical protein [Zobellia sp. 1_MG-2023]MDO6819491.1 hypothetical protein [Zobellia sp. 1_MG-2023]
MENMNCPSCKKEYLESVDICSNCRYPFSGTEKEKAIHIGKFINQKGVLVDSEASIEKSQKILYGVTVINLVFLAIGFFNGTYPLLHILLNAVLIVVFLFCAYFIKKSPLMLTIIPLALLIGVYTINFIVDPNSVLRGVIMKLFILGSLIYSIYLIKSAEGFKKNFGLNG